jgi:hypothetical protein
LFDHVIGGGQDPTEPSTKSAYREALDTVAARGGLSAISQFFVAGEAD